MQSLRKLLCRPADDALRLYAVLDSAADDRTLAPRLADDSVRAHCLFTNEATHSAAAEAPYLVGLDDQPELLEHLITNGWGRCWGIFLQSAADEHTVLAHVRKYFHVQGSATRKVMFRFYDPRVICDYLPLLTEEEQAAFFGPVARIIAEDDSGGAKIFDRPQGVAPRREPWPVLDPQKQKGLAGAWKKRCLKARADDYRALGFTVLMDENANALTLTDAAGDACTLQNTANGVSATTAAGTYAYQLTRCGNPVAVTDPAGHTISFDIQERDTDNQARTNLLHAIRMPDRAWTFEYDDMNHLQELAYPDGACIRATHDPYGNLTSLTDRGGHTRALQRDEHERLSAYTDANGRRTEFVYGDFDAPERIGFADGQSLGFVFTDEGALARFLAGGQTVADYRVDRKTGSWHVTWTDGTWARYDVQNGRIVNAANAAGTVELTYDAAGNLISERFGGRTISYQRGAFGRLTGLGTSWGRRLGYTHDGAGRITRITDWHDRPIDLTYAENGALAAIAYPNGTRLELHPDADGLPARIALTGAGQTLIDRRITRDRASRVTRIDENEHWNVYSYDAAGRLTDACSTRAALNETFTLDAKGNRLADKKGTTRVNSADRIVDSHSHDALGNVTRANNAAYTYTSANRLTTAQVGGRQTTFIYDAFGRRIEKRGASERTRFIWAGNQILREIRFTEHGEHVIDYLFYPDTPVLLALCSDDRTHWAAFGHRSEVLSLTDSQGALSWTAHYDAYGTAHIVTGHDLPQPFRLPGHYLDPETGLHHAGARYYDPGLGRYLSLDPMFLQCGSENFYTYCDGDPINRTDPTGRFIFVPILIGAALGAVIGAAVEAVQQHQAGKGMDGFKIATAALTGALIGAVGGGVGAAIEAVVGASTLAGMGAAGFLSAAGASIAEQCTQAAATGQGIAPLDMAAQAMTDGIIGAGIALLTFGAGAFYARRIKKAVQAFSPNLPSERAAIVRQTKQKTRQLNADTQTRSKRASGASDEKCVGDPVNPVTGAVVLTQTDVTLPGRLPLAWTRHYTSQNPYSGDLGPGWQTPADSRLEIDGQGIVTFFDASPRAAVFEKPPQDEPVLEAANGAVLKAVEDEYQLTLKSGVTYHFARIPDAGTTFVTRISDPDGNHIDFVREGNTLTRLIDSRGQQIGVTREHGRIVSLSRGEQPLVRYHYERGRLIGAMDPAGHSKRFYYENGRLARHKDKNNLSFHYTYDDNGRCTHTRGDNGLYAYTLAYDPLARQTRVTDSRGHTSIYTYDADNQPLAITDPTGAVTAYEYDDVGRITAVTDPLGHQTQYTYDASGNLTELVRPDHNRMAFVYADNRPVQILDANGKLWEHRYDEKGRLIESITPLNAHTGYTYNAKGDLTRVMDPEGRTQTFEWDDHGFLKTRIDAAGARTHFQHDAWGNITAIIDPTGAATRYSYDQNHRPIQALRPSGISQTFAWDPEGNLLLHTDENGAQTRYEYTGLNELSRRLNPDGTSIGYHYDSEENLIAVTNERGQSYRFDYDAANRVQSRSDYFGNTHRYGYDAAGRLIESIDPLNRVITYGHDPLGRLTAKTLPLDQREVFVYDGNGNLTAMECGEATVQRWHDAAGHLIAEKTNDFIVNYQYDASGLRTARRTSCGNTVRYGYDDCGRLDTVTINDHDPIIIARDVAGKIIHEKLTPHLARSYGYDPDGQLTRQSIEGAGAHITRRYDYDLTGNLIARFDSAKGNWRFTHDPAGRIIQASDPLSQVHQYTYDPAGDLLEHLAEPQNNLRSARHKGVTYRFDAAGNLAQREQDNALTRYSFDENNRLKKVRLPGGDTITMTYDAAGRRVTKAVNGQRTFFAWDGDSLLCEWADEKPAREYVFYPGTFIPLALIDADGQVYYYHNDVNGLPCEVTRHNGDIVWSATYDALGRIEKLLVDEIAQPLRLQGQYFDQETGLCYNRHRYFDPAICSFISQDSIGLAGGENVYAYAPNVWGWVDPLGLCCKATTTSNPLPSDGTFARVMPAKYAEAFAIGKGNIGGGSEVFVTSADDLVGIATKSAAQHKLSLFIDYEGKTPNFSGDALVTFKVKDLNGVGLRSPIETKPARGYGFVHGGKTAGGAREWLFNNGTASELGIYDIKITPLR